MTRTPLDQLFVEGTPEHRAANALHLVPPSSAFEADVIEVLYALDHARDVAVAAIDPVGHCLICGTTWTAPVQDCPECPGPAVDDQVRAATMALLSVVNEASLGDIEGWLADGTITIDEVQQAESLALAVLRAGGLRP